MLKPLLNSTSLPLLEKVAIFGERRQHVLAGNVANVDTPGYKTRDLPVSAFQEALQDAVQSRHTSLSVSQAAAGNAAPERPLEEFFPSALFQGSETAGNNITFHDGGNRSIEHEVMELTKNAMMQNFAVELMTSQMNLLQTVIRERV